MNKTIHNTPNWIYEAAGCIAAQYSDNDESLIENHNKFGLTKEEMTEYMKSYLSYKEAVTSEIITIFRKYPNLEKYFHKINLLEDENFYFAMSLVMYFGESLTTDISNDVIDKILNKFTADAISEYLSDIKNVDIKINNIEDLLSSIDKVDIEDEVKVLLINLYHTRYKTIKELAELLNKCAPICEKHYPIIKDDFNKATKRLNETENLEALLDSAYKIKITFPPDGDIYSTIFFFNGLSIFSIDDTYTFYIGIYFFDYVDLKRKNRFDDVQIVADLKAIGDSTRLKIIHLLSKNKMYIQELAEELELTPATVSHHINILLKAELVSITLDAEKTKKIFYEVNTDKFINLGDTIKSLINYIGGNEFE